MLAQVVLVSGNDTYTVFGTPNSKTSGLSITDKPMEVFIILISEILRESRACANNSAGFNDVMAMVARMPITIITTRSSTMVKADRLDCGIYIVCNLFL